MNDEIRGRAEVLGDLVRHGLAPAVLAAAQCGLLDALADEPTALDVLAARCGVVPRGAALVLDALAAVGVCEKIAGGYRRDRGLDALWPWSGLPGLLTAGEVVSPIDDRSRRGEAYATAVEYLAARFAEPAAFFAARLGPAGSILDVGCGSGVWSLAMLPASPSARLVGIDLPEVVPRFLARAAAAGHGARVEGIAADYFLDPPALGARQFDRVILANILHLEDEAGAAHVVDCWARRVAPGGSLIVLDCIPDGSPQGELERAFYALHLGLRTAKGGVHAPSALARWCAAAGLPAHDIVASQHWRGFGAFVARR